MQDEAIVGCVLFGVAVDYSTYSFLFADFCGWQNQRIVLLRTTLCVLMGWGFARCEHSQRGFVWLRWNAEDDNVGLVV